MYDFWFVELLLDFGRLVNRVLRYLNYRNMFPMIWGFIDGLF